MFVLGIDPGLSRCGYGLVVRGETDSALKARAAGVIETDPEAPLPQRLLILHTELRALVAEFSPDVVAVERVFFQVNVKTAMSVGQASGLALVAAAEAGCEVIQYTANEADAPVPLRVLSGTEAAAWLEAAPAPVVQVAAVASDTQPKQKDKRGKVAPAQSAQ